MKPRTAIAEIARLIGRELDTGVGPSEEALAAGPMMAKRPSRAGRAATLNVPRPETRTAPPR